MLKIERITKIVACLTLCWLCLVAVISSTGAWVHGIAQSGSLPFAYPSVACNNSTASAAANTSALQTALTAAGASTGPAQIYLPSGICYFNQLTLYSNTYLVGNGANNTIVKLNNTQNTALIQTYNFSSLTGGNTTGGVGDFELRDLTLDCNASNNTGTANPCLQIYGWEYRLIDIQVRYSNGIGIYTEWSGSAGCPNSSTAYCMEAFIRGVKVYENNDEGIQTKGPHDSMWDQVITSQNCVSPTTATCAGFDLANNAGGGNGGNQFSHVHSWGSGQKWAYYLQVPAQMQGFQAEGASIGQIAVLYQGTIVANGSIFGCSSNAVQGLQIGKSGSSVAYTTAGNLQVTNGCNIYFLDDAGGDQIYAHVDSTNAQLTGTPNVDSSSYDLMSTNSGGIAGIRNVGPYTGGCEGWTYFTSWTFQICQQSSSTALIKNGGATALAILPDGHITGGATTSAGVSTIPTLTSCGTGTPAISGTDFNGAVTLGTSATGCTITFATAYTIAPFCNVTWQNTPLASQNYTVSTTAIILTQSSTSGNIVNYTCIAPIGGG